ncbi:MAG: ribosome small subunit-dependent GTPase A [Phycisphaerae bacterium]|nr:ribosome small subunit-dependent GTPase A [Phycisphaerae bacterium]MCZ2401134.1 ribosome small subunit-dependent GTPase A [Phycisphaerae bacterium]
MNLAQLGWNPDIEARYRALAGVDARGSHILPARVARQDRDSYVVYAAVAPDTRPAHPVHGRPCRALRASLRGALRHDGPAHEWPAVGDWVAVLTSPGHAGGRIEAVVPRRSCIVRKAAGDAVQAQVLAANVDTLAICCGLDGDFNLRRIERYLTLAYASGAAPAVVLTKADLCDTGGERVETRVAQVEAIAPGVPVIAVSMYDPQRLRERIAPLARAGRTVALVGSSGAGKSTLINVLLGREAMRTGAVRMHDSRGRHTTTHRQLLLTPAGGVVIDSPGMRELQLWSDDGDVDASFSDVAGLAAGCRFRDCTHDQEPGCAVKRAVQGGALPAERLAAYHKQRRELAFLERKTDARARAEETARWKAIHKSAREWYRRKRGI